MEAPGKAWWDAYYAFQKERPTLVKKDREVTVESKKGDYTYSHTSIDLILKMVEPLLQKHGFAYDQDVVTEVVPTGDNARLLYNVTTTITHVESLQEKVFGPIGFWAADIHEGGSIVTYCRRYGLLPALGMAASDDDDDGKKVIEGDKARADQATADAEAAKIIKDKRDLVTKGISATKSDLAKALALYKDVTKLEDMTIPQLDDLIAKLKTKRKNQRDAAKKTEPAGAGSNQASGQPASA